ncbi:epoxide hydrolase family protein [Salix suchowensis]|nr:epoxide hydrolase family protein [Salix suchowensis]
MEKIEHTTVATNGINMHIASIGTGPAILFLHGFPELWYSWRHQLLSLSSLGYRCIAPDLRGYGDTDAPKNSREYTVFHILGDLVGLIDSLGIDKVFLVGHDWGAMVAWYFCMLRPDRIKALVNMSVVFQPRNPHKSVVQISRDLFGDDYYICRFQEPGQAEEDFAQMDTARIIRKFLTSRNPKPPCIPKEVGFRGLPDSPNLPSWLNWELTAAFTGLQIEVPVKFIVGELDITYNMPGAQDYITKGGLKKHVPFLQEVVIMEGAAHFINQEKPEEVSAHIYDFIKKFN